MRARIVGAVLLVLVGLGGCAIFGPAERADLTKHAATLEVCQERGREASKVCLATGGDRATCDHEAIAAYKACKADGGVK